jgi:hypothetical protein
MSTRSNTLSKSTLAGNSQPKRGITPTQKRNQESTTSSSRIQVSAVVEEVQSTNDDFDDSSNQEIQSQEVEIVNAAEEEAGSSAKLPEFDKLSGGEIYELLNNTSNGGRSPPWIVHFNGKKLGHIFNRIFYLLLANNMIVTKEVAKNKIPWNEQRKEFEEMGEKGLTLMRELIRTEMLTSQVPKKIQGVTKKETPVLASLFCRIAHMVMEPNCQDILSQIHAGASLNREEERVLMDDTSCRIVSRWNELCMDYFNNVNFNPSNCISPELIEVKPELAGINPSLPPEKPWDSNRLKAEYNNLRNKYTKLHGNFTKSGQNMEDSNHIAGDVEFMEKYCEGDLVYAYLHVVFDRSPPKFILREMPEKSRFEVGIKKSPESAQSNSKRKYENNQVIHLSEKEFELEAKRAKAAIDRDEAIAIETTRMTLEATRSTHMNGLLQQLKNVQEILKDDDSPLLFDNGRKEYELLLKQLSNEYVAALRSNYLK